MKRRNFLGMLVAAPAICAVPAISGSPRMTASEVALRNKGAFKWINYSSPHQDCGRYFERYKVEGDNLLRVRPETHDGFMNPEWETAPLEMYSYFLKDPYKCKLKKPRRKSWVK